MTLRELREAKDWRPADVASRIGTTESQVYSWEAGQIPRSRTRVALAQLYGVDATAIQWHVEDQG